MLTIFRVLQHPKSSNNNWQIANPLGKSLTGKENQSAEEILKAVISFENHINHLSGDDPRDPTEYIFLATTDFKLR